MKASELMIGDWVTGKKWIKNPFHLTRITEAFCYGKTASGAVVGPFFFEEIVPIPLTPEILEKNGLSKLVTYGTEKWVCDRFRLNEYDNKGVWRFCAYTNRNEDSVIYIRYVHELQHALKLCGIEKEITL